MIRIIVMNGDEVNYSCSHGVDNLRSLNILLIYANSK